ncbi:MAG: sigma-70 family RNA polymerase sigma factor [Pseudomonadota bacterium]
MSESARLSARDAQSIFATRPSRPRKVVDCPSSEQSPPRVTRLYEDYAAQLSATLRKMYGDGPPDPDDIAQAAFEKVLERGDTASIRNLKAFLWSTARNLLRKEIRSRDVRDRYAFDIEQIFFVEVGDDRTPERAMEAKQQLNSINDLLRKMPERRRRALILHRIDGLSVAEVGRRMGVGRTAAAKHVARACEDIDTMLAEQAER